LLVACDLYRPAAIDQLVTLAGQIDVPVFAPDRGETDLLKVAREAIAYGEEKGATVLIFDTAGRQEIDDKLIEELKRLHAFIKPKETMLVADAATGQQAVSVAKHFDDAVGITG
ncbi:MAG: signal recognition particle protein, partial [bacterium]